MSHGDPTVEREVDEASLQSAENEGTAEDLLARLLQCDEQLAAVLSQAAAAIRGIAPRGQESKGDFEQHTRQWFATLNEIQMTLRDAAHALRQAQLPPLTSPATARARLSGEAGIAGRAHALYDETPLSLSALRIRELAWRQVAESLQSQTAQPDCILTNALLGGASLG